VDPSLCLRVTSLGVPQSVCDTDTVAIDVRVWTVLYSHLDLG